MTPEMDPDAELAVTRIAYEQGRHAIDVQIQALADLRTRAGTVLAAASLVASFLGAPAVAKYTSSGHANRWWIAVALLFLMGLLGVCLVLLTGHKFKFRQAPKTILEDLDDQNYISEVQALRALAQFLEDDHDSNERKLSCMNVGFRVACGLLIAETVALIVALK